MIAPSLHYITRQVALSWRQRLSTHLYGLFFRHNAFYKSMHVYQGASHPDQRITEDLDRVSGLGQVYMPVFMCVCVCVCMCVCVYVCVCVCVCGVL